MNNEVVKKIKIIKVADNEKSNRIFFNNSKSIEEIIKHKTNTLSKPLIIFFINLLARNYLILLICFCVLNNSFFNKLF